LPGASCPPVCFCFFFYSHGAKTLQELRGAAHDVAAALRHIFERAVIAAMEMGLVKGKGFAVDASVDNGLRSPCIM
jgi:hypothetical protein